MLDAVDLRIVKALVEDGRLSAEAVAARVGLSPTPVRRRIRRLEEAGVLKGYTAVVDLKRLGLELGLYVFVKLATRELASIEAFETQIRRLPDVLRCDMITGAHDFVLLLRCANIEHFNELLRGSLALLPGVAGIETSVVVAEVKNSPLPL